MRRLRIAVVLATLAVLALPTVGATEEAWEPTPGGWVSGPVEHVATVATEAGGAGDGVLRGDLLYVTGFRGFSIYDVSDPLAPALLSSVPLAPALFNEEPQTNGEILLISRDGRVSPRAEGVPAVGGVLDIWDVSDPTAPAKIGEYESTIRDHIWACVLDCAYAYSSAGTILDLSDPTSPTAVGLWTDVAPYRLTHAIAEVAPGILMTGTVPAYILDARDDPTAPEVLTTFEVPTQQIDVGGMPESVPARVAWPNARDRGAVLGDRIALVSMETPFTGSCDGEEDGKLLTFDTTGWQGRGFRHVDSYDVSENGVYTDGNPPYNAVGCSAYQFDPRPGYGNRGRQVATAFFEHGVRLVGIGRRGQITEIAGFTPHAGASAAPVWVTDDILYVMDLNRGIDILRFDG